MYYASAMLRGIIWLAVAATNAAMVVGIQPSMTSAVIRGSVVMQDATRDSAPYAWTGEQQQPNGQQGMFAQQGYAAPATYGPLLRVVPVYGVLNEYTVSNGGQQVLGRYDMGPPTRYLASGKLKPDPRPYISRMQCVVRAAADGTITLEHVGKNHRPTARLAPDGKWYYLRKGEVHVLTEGERFSLDSKDPEGAVYTVYVQQGGFSQAQPAQGGYSQQVGY